MEELTIIIPTYNRPKELRRTLQSIVPQLTNERLIILDNCSSYDLKQDVEEFIENQPKISIVRNKVNIGLSGNFLKAFELCRSKYLWILSDDDVPHKNAIDTIRESLLIEDYALVKFSSSLYSESQNRVLTSSEDFMVYYSTNSDRKFSNLVFISNTIFNTELVEKNIQYGYQFSNTFAPHLAIIFYTFFKSEKANLFISKDELVKQEQQLEDRWTLYKVHLGFKSFEFADLNLTEQHFKKFIKILRSSRGYYRTVFVELLKLQSTGCKTVMAKNIYRYLYFDYNFGIKDFMAMRFLYWCLDKPFTTKVFKRVIGGFESFYNRINLSDSDKRL